MTRLHKLALTALLIGVGAAPAMARSEPTTRVVKCGAESCLQISGRRADATAPVSLNGHAVMAEGALKWRVRVPVRTVRAWSEPYARTIAVSVAEASTETDLPIGLLGGTEKLAMLVVRAK